MQRQFRLGGGVARRAANLRGQSIIEYVLIIAIIGLVIVFAGPGVAGAIRNQFNLVGNTVNNGTCGSTEGGGASGGGSAGVDSSTVQAAVAKDAKDWTLDEQKAVADDIAAKGEASPAFAKAKAAMGAGTKFSMKLTDGQTLEYKIIGINHDDLADGSGKAGLTFLTTSNDIYDRMNATNTNTGGWEASELRAKMNSGEIWNLMPTDFKSKVKPVKKLTNNVGGGKENMNAAVTATTDKLFLLSGREIWNNSKSGKYYTWVDAEGAQYEAFNGKLWIGHSDPSIVMNRGYWWTRSSFAGADYCFDLAGAGGRNAADSSTVCPAWCF